MAKYLDEDGLKTLWGKIKQSDNAVANTINSYKTSNDAALAAEIKRAKDAENANSELIISAHGKVSINANTSIFEKGIPNSVMFTATADFNGSADRVKSIEIYADSTMTLKVAGTTAAKQGSVSCLVQSTDTIKRYTTANIGGVTKTASCTAYAYYPMYLIASATDPTAENITKGTKLPISSTGAGSKTITTANNQYIYLAIPEGVSIPTSATMSGFKCPLASNIEVTGVMVNKSSVKYTLVRTQNAMKAGTNTIVYN